MVYASFIQKGEDPKICSKCTREGVDIDTKRMCMHISTPSRWYDNEKRTALGDTLFTWHHNRQLAADGIVMVRREGRAMPAENHRECVQESSV